MKKIFLLIMVLALSGCGTPKQTTPNSLGLIEEDVTIGTTYPLKGKITYSKELKEKAPAVILVHGSGPNDMNETVGNTKMFEDLAYGLAKKGIIVLRYDKITYSYGKELSSSDLFKQFTYQEEIINDVGLAKEVIASFKYTDPNQIFVLGHSMGGMLVPEIDRQFSFDGLIIMAGTPKSMIDVIISQNKALIKSDSPDLLKKQVEDAVTLLESIKSMTDVEAQDFQLQGITGYYLKSFEHLQSLDILSQITKPVLIMQGTEDFQVKADDDYLMYQEALIDHNNVSFKLYKGLNHVFISSNGEKDLTEYNQDKRVDQEVINDIATFIKQKN